MALDPITIFEQALAQHKYHVTKARLATFKLLLGTAPQTMAELLAQAKGQVDRVSVYRNIELFEKLGIVNRIYIGWKYKLELSDQFTSHHHHLSCLRCGQIIDIDDEKHINDFIQQVSAEFGFKPQSHQFEIAGYCRKCRA